MPGGTPVGSSVTTTSAGAPPVVVERVSQGCVLVAVQVIEPFPELVTRSVVVLGAVEPALADSLIARGVTARPGARTVSTTLTRWGLPVAPGAVTTISPV